MAHNVYSNMALQLDSSEKAIVEVATSTSLNVGVQGGVLLEEERSCMRTHIGLTVLMLIQEKARISMPPCFQAIMYSPNIPQVNTYVQRLLGPLMRNNLIINADGNPGVGKYRDYFLSAQIDDKNLLWDTKEVDWRLFSSTVET
jgi:hypothetical protein